MLINIFINIYILKPTIEQKIREEQREGASIVDTLFGSDKNSETVIDWGSDSTWPDWDLPGTWGTFGLQGDPWNDNYKPYAISRKYEDLKLDEIEEAGVLTDRILAVSSSYLDRSPETQKYVLCKANLSSKGLQKIEILGYHHYLQYVDLSKNKLLDCNVKVLGQLPFLMHLNLSYNNLTEVLNFAPPINLMYVNYSNNLINSIADLKEFWSIVTLDISVNKIETITGLQNLKFLRHLNLSNNMIQRIENLNNMKLLTLDLSNNCISEFEEGVNVGFNTLIDILRINLACNQLTTLKMFAGVNGIQAIDMSSNLLEDLMELNYLKDLNFLTHVDFRNNPINSMHHYMQVCINCVKYLHILDDEIISAQQKVSVKTKYAPSPFTEAAKKFTQLMFLQGVNDPFIGPSIVPYDQPMFPIIVLVGPPGSNKGIFLHQFCKLHSRHTALGVSHTSRPKNVTEVEGESYYFVSSAEFIRLAQTGHFVAVSQTLGRWFGFAEDEFKKVLGTASVLMLHTDLVGALTLRAKYHNCYLVLAIIRTVSEHGRVLLRKYCHIENANNRLGGEVGKDPAETATSKSPEKRTTNFIQTILEQLIDNVVCEDETFLEEKSLDSMPLQKEPSSQSKLGILKGSSRRSSKSHTESETGRFSVTFHNQGEPLLNDLCVLLNKSGETIDSDNASMPQTHSATFLNEVDLDLHVEQHISHPNKIHLEEQQSYINSLLSDSLLMDSHSNESLEATSELRSLIIDFIRSRDKYVETHHSNPGLFTEVIFTDHLDDANFKLQEVLKMVVKSQPPKHLQYDFRKDAVYESMVMGRLEDLRKEMNNQLSTSDNQMSIITRQNTSTKKGMKCTMMSEQSPSTKHRPDITKQQRPTSPCESTRSN